MRRFAILCALVLLPLAAACEDLVLGSEPEGTNATIFDHTWREFDRHYAFFQMKGIDWQDARLRYRPNALIARTPGQLAAILWNMMEELDDNHVALITPFGQYSIDTGIREPGEAVSWSRTLGDVGYIRIAEFNGGIEAIDRAIDDLGDLDGIIVDVRRNAGGLVERAEDIAGRFVDRKQVYAYVRYRNGPGHSDFTDQIPLDVGPAGRRYRGGVVVLTDRRTFSAAETFVLAMKTSDRVTTVGDTTGGSVGKALTRELPNGWILKVPQWITLTTDGSVIEDVGLPPDVLTPPATQEDDPPLRRALELLRATGSAP